MNESIKNSYEEECKAGGRKVYNTDQEIKALRIQDKNCTNGSFSNACFKAAITFSIYPQNYGPNIYAAFLPKEVAMFTGSIFFESVNFNNCAFENQVRFDDAVFLGDVNFSDVKFLEKVTFWRTKFYGKVCFGNTKFSKLADFYSVHFEETIDFEKTRFEETVVFSEAYFKEDVKFSFATLGNMIFREATFEKGLDLSLAANPNSWEGNFFLMEHSFKNLDDSDIDYVNQRETFRIIKSQLLKQNNNIEALKFSSLEMQAYKKELNKNAKKIKRKMMMKKQNGENCFCYV